MDESSVVVTRDELTFEEEGFPPVELVAAQSLYRRILWLKEDRAKINERIKVVTGLLKNKLAIFGPLVEEGKRKAQIVIVGATYSYPKKEMDEFVNGLFQSDDETVREIARCMVDLRKPKNGYERLDIR